MLDPTPFVATRYRDSTRLAALTSPAYDLVPPEERARLGEADEHNIVHLTLPTPDPVVPGPEAAARRLARWRGDGTLAVDDGPALWCYDLGCYDLGCYDLAAPDATDRGSTRGWLAAVRLDPEAVVPHEDTVAAVVADRMRLRTATRADLEPIVLAHDGAPAAADELGRAVVARSEPLVDLVDGDGVRHRLWRVGDPDEIAAVVDDLRRRRAVIADGHHRWASCLADGQARARPGPWDRVLALVVPAGPYGPQVRAIHRVVPGLALDRAATAGFRAEPVEPLTAAQAEELLASAPDPLVLLTDGERWLRLTDPDRDLLLAGSERAAQWRDLDVALVDIGLVENAWSASDDVLLRHPVAAAVATARAHGGVAALVRATPVATVLGLAERGVRMPRKSTLFVPKPRTGLVLRCFADQ